MGTFNISDMPSGPRNPDYLLRAGELEAMFEDFEILSSSETVTERKAVASLVARRRTEFATSLA